MNQEDLQQQIDNRCPCFARLLSECDCNSYKFKLIINSDKEILFKDFDEAKANAEFWKAKSHIVDVAIYDCSPEIEECVFMQGKYNGIWEDLI